MTPLQNIEIRHGRVIDPASGRDCVESVFIADGHILALGDVPAGFIAEKVIDASGLVVCPGLIDLSARKLTQESELCAAVAGGITTACCPPDTDPPLDEPSLISPLLQGAASIGKARVAAIGALTLGLKGETLAEMVNLARAGCIAFSQAGRPLAGHRTLRRALQYAATFDLPVWLHAEDTALGNEGVAHEGEVAARLGLAGIPVSAETVALHCIIELATETGARVHLTRLSSAAGVDIVSRAKARGVRLTCDVSIHSLHYCDASIGHFNTNARLAPPLRSLHDRAGLRKGLSDGVIDALCSDHTPVSDDGKLLPFDEAKPGAIGLELLLPLALRWAASENRSVASALATITCGPAALAGLPGGRLHPGALADLCLFDPAETWTVSGDTLQSPYRNSLSLGENMHGRVKFTIVGGRTVFSR